MAKVYNQQDKQPWATRIFLAINIIVFLYIEWVYGAYGSSENVAVLIRMGAKFTPLMVYDQQWWRLITAGFIHIGWSHLIINMFSLYFIGEELEAYIGLGSVKFIAIYLTSVIGGNLFSAAFNLNVSAGASTAIFGLFMVFIVLARIYPKSHYLSDRSRSFVVLLVINAINGVLASGIDNWGHFGGAVFGGLMTYILARRPQADRAIPQRLLAFLALLALAYGLVHLCFLRLI